QLPAHFSALASRRRADARPHGGDENFGGTGLVAGIYGTSGDDTLNGTSGDDIIAGLDGADTVDGGDGNDTIYAGAVAPGWSRPWNDSPYVAPMLDTGAEADPLIGGN